MTDKNDKNHKFDKYDEVVEWAFSQQPDCAKLTAAYGKLYKAFKGIAAKHHVKSSEAIRMALTLWTEVMELVVRQYRDQDANRRVQSTVPTPRTKVTTSVKSVTNEPAAPTDNKNAVQREATAKIAKGDDEVGSVTIISSDGTVTTSSIDEFMSSAILRARGGRYDS
jgi:membrane-bound lytic murein transglycosylase